MCKLLVLKGHPSKFVQCKNKCNECTTKEYVQAGLLLWFITLCIGVTGLVLLS